MNRQQGQCYTNVLMPTPTPNLLVSLSAPHSDTRCACARAQSTVETHGTHLSSSEESGRSRNLRFGRHTRLIIRPHPSCPTCGGACRPQTRIATPTRHRPIAVSHQGSGARRSESTHISGRHARATSRVFTSATRRRSTSGTRRGTTAIRYRRLGIRRGTTPTKSHRLGTRRDITPKRRHGLGA